MEKFHTLPTPINSSLSREDLQYPQVLRVKLQVSAFIIHKPTHGVYLVETSSYSLADFYR